MLFGKKRDIIWRVVLLLISIILFIIGMYNLFRVNSKSYEYDDLKYDEYTIQYVKQIIPKGHGGQYARRYYEITVEEEKKPLLIDSLSVDGMNEDIVKNAKKGEMISCYITKSEEDKYSYVLIEFKISNEIILTLNTYNKLHRNSNIMLVITFVAFAIAFFCVSIKNIKKSKQKDN